MDVAQRDYYLMFGDYELIEWTDGEGKKWNLGPASGGDVPVKTRFTSEQIQDLRKERVNAASNNTSEP